MGLGSAAVAGSGLEEAGGWGSAAAAWAAGWAGYEEAASNRWAAQAAAVGLGSAAGWGWVEEETAGSGSGVAAAAVAPG